MNLGDLLPVFAATDAAAASAERNGKFTEFPDEEPTVKQMNDWLEVNLPVITKSHGELMLRLGRIMACIWSIVSDGSEVQLNGNC